MALALALALNLTLASGFDLKPNPANLDIFGPGPVLNLGLGNKYVDQAWTNASAHVAWGTLIPVAADKLWGRKGVYVACGLWTAWTLTNETWFHGKTPAPEVRTDLASREIGCIGYVAYKLLSKD